MALAPGAGELWGWAACTAVGVYAGTTSGYCIATESDPELEVEYREKLEHEFLDTDSQSGSNTVNQDDDSFSVLGGDSLNEQELPEQEMPPLFMHLTCSVKLRSQHSSMPVRSLPTCLGKDCPRAAAQGFGNSGPLQAAFRASGVVGAGCHAAMHACP